MMLTRSYCDMRGCDATDLANAIVEEVEFYADAAGVDDDPDTVVELLDRHFEDSEHPFDVGVAAAVVAISVAGGAPISSCNGGWFRDGHSSDVPHVVFSSAPGDVGVVSTAAAAAGCGLINNGPHAELYADELPKLLDFARAVQSLISHAR